ncbi:MAG: MFS transporter [Chloroflexota bacterium]
MPRSRMFWAVSLGHMTNDLFMSMGPVVLAFLSVTILPMSNTQIGLTVSATQMMGAISQPGFGLMADRNGGRWLGAGGVVWTAGFFMLALVMSQTGYFWLMFVPFVLMALGSGAFHPAGAMHAANSERGQEATSLSYFFLMGQFGLALGPVVAGLLLDAANPASDGVFAMPFNGVVNTFIFSGHVASIYLVGVLVIPVVWWMFSVLPVSSLYREVLANSPRRAPLKLSALPWGAFSVLGAMVALRSLAQPGSVTFIPVLFQQKGWTPSEYGVITSLFWVGSGIAGIVFGNLADHFDRRRVVAITLMLAAPTFFLLPVFDGATALLLAVAAGALSGGSHSIIVVLAQELIPAAKGFASGAILGFIFGMGALGSVLIGSLSDSIGLGTTFQLVAVAIVIAGVLALLLPARRAPTALDTTGPALDSETVVNASAR